MGENERFNKNAKLVQNLVILAVTSAILTIALRHLLWQQDFIYQVPAPRQ